MVMKIGLNEDLGDRSAAEPPPFDATSSGSVAITAESRCYVLKLLARLSQNPQLKDAGWTVQALLLYQGSEEALKTAQSELRKARRSRSRKRFAFWAAITTQIRMRVPTEA